MVAAAHGSGDDEDEASAATAVLLQPRRSSTGAGANQAPLSLDGDAGRSIVRKLNMHVLPLMLMLASLCYLDRTTVAFASVAMNRDLGFSAEVYGLGSGLFFAGYAVAMLPSQLVLMRVGAPLWLAVIVVGWGITAMAFALMQTRSQFWALRVLLGVFESGAFPGLWTYLKALYPPDSITVPFSLVEAAVGIANVAGAPLAAGLLLLDGAGGWEGWRWLFLVEGIPSVACGCAMWRLLPRDAASARFLTAAEKSWLAATHAANRAPGIGGSSGSGGGGMQPSGGAGVTTLLLDALRQPRIWLLGLAALLKNAALVGLLFWAPSVVDGLLHGGDTRTGGRGAGAAAGARLLLGGGGGGGSGRPRGAAAVLLTAVPFIGGAAAAVALGARSQARRERCRHAGVPYLAAAVLLVAYPALSAAGGVAAFAGLSAAIAALTAPNAVLNALAAAAAGTRASSPLALALYNCVGNLGGLVGPWVIGRVLLATGTYAPALQGLGLLVAGAGALCVGLFPTWGLPA